LIILKKLQENKMNEHQEQVNFIQWCNRNIKKYPELKLIFAIPNGGHRHKAVASKLKLEGVKAGVPDLLFPVSRHNKHGLFIEMKSIKGQISFTQKEWIINLQKQNYKVVVAYGHKEAQHFILQYLS